MTRNEKIASGLIVIAVVIFLYYGYTQFQSMSEGGDGETGSLQIQQSMIKKTASDGFNNPGNIKQNSVVFKGEIRNPFEYGSQLISPLDNKFKSFVSMAYGYRAMTRILRTYVKKGYVTLNQIISRYAPSTENNTVSYVNYISSRAGIDPNANLTELINGQYVSELIKHMTRMEQGANFVIDDEEVRTGVNLA